MEEQHSYQRAEHGHVEVIEELLSNTDIDVNHVNHLGPDSPDGGDCLK